MQKSLSASDLASLIFTTLFSSLHTPYCSLFNSPPHIHFFSSHPERLSSNRPSLSLHLASTFPSAMHTWYLFCPLHSPLTARAVTREELAALPGALALCTCNYFSFCHTLRISYTPSSSLVWELLGIGSESDCLSVPRIRMKSVLGTEEML